MTPLHMLGNALREWLAMVPLPVVRGLFVAFPLLVLVWLLRLPRAATAESGGATSANLKVWAALALLIQVLIYALV